MKIVAQRVKTASVSIDGGLYSKINAGFMLLFGVEKADKLEFIDYISNKILNLRVFSDDLGKMNLSIKDINGEILVVSQFTLAANCKKGNRPGFDNAMEPKTAEKYYEMFVSKLKEAGLTVKTGVFGADMQVELINDGPVTFILEKKSEENC